jgi:hypothetical protein
MPGRRDRSVSCVEQIQLAERSGNVIKTFTAIVVVAVIASGCMVASGKFQTGESFQEKQIAQVKPGTTTKQQILDWFGPPAAMARQDSAQKIPAAGSEKAGNQDVQVDTFLELFSSKNVLTEHHIVYYYTATEIRSSQVWVIVAGTTDKKVSTDRLWVLIDDRTGTVVDYIFRKAQ